MNYSLSFKNCLLQQGAGAVRNSLLPSFQIIPSAAFGRSMGSPASWQHGLTVHEKLEKAESWKNVLLLLASLFTRSWRNIIRFAVIKEISENIDIRAKPKKLNDMKCQQTEIWSGNCIKNKLKHDKAHKYKSAE